MDFIDKALGEIGKIVTPNWFTGEMAYWGHIRVEGWTAVDEVVEYSNDDPVDDLGYLFILQYLLKV